MESNTLGKELSRRAGWSIFMGFLTAAAGVFMIFHPLATAAVSTIFLGSAFLVVAFAQVAFAFASRKGGGFLVRLLVGVLYGIVGALLLVFPLSGVLTLTAVLGTTLLLQFILEAWLAAAAPEGKGGGWFALSAFCSLFAGLLILSQWPSSAAWAIGTFVGVSVLTNGIARTVVSLGLRRDLQDIPQAAPAA